VCTGCGNDNHSDMDVFISRITEGDPFQILDHRNLAGTALEHIKNLCDCPEEHDIPKWAALAQVQLDLDEQVKTGDFLLLGIDFQEKLVFGNGRNNRAMQISMAITEHWPSTQWDAAKQYWTELAQELDA